MNKPEKLKKLRQYAYSIGLCKYCFVRERQEDKTKCIYCFNHHASYQKKLRAKPDRCSRCGQKNTGNFKTCTKCRK